MLNEPQTPNMTESIHYFESMASFIETLGVIQQKIREIIK